MKHCACGCGAAIQERNKNGPLHFYFGHGRKGKKYPNENKFQAGEANNNWRGGRVKSVSGYILLRQGNRYVPEHILLMEQNLGRQLTEYESVHHINGIKDDNRLANLIVLTKGEHSSHHRKKEYEQGRYFGRSLKKYGYFRTQTNKNKDY